jgi:hypothetical protein
VPRTFRENVDLRKLWDAEHAKRPRERHFALPVAGPYHVEWRLGPRRQDLERLICMGGPAGRKEANRAARRSKTGIECETAMPPGEARPILIALTRDLLRELEMVLDADARVRARRASGSCRWSRARSRPSPTYAPRASVPRSMRVMTTLPSPPQPRTVGWPSSRRVRARSKSLARGSVPPTASALAQGRRPRAKSRPYGPGEEGCPNGIDLND